MLIREFVHFTFHFLVAKTCVSNHMKSETASCISDELLTVTWVRTDQALEQTENKFQSENAMRSSSLMCFYA